MAQDHPEWEILKKTKSLQVMISVLLLAGFFYFIDTNEMFSVISYSDKWCFLLACILSFFGNAACAFRWTKILNCESKIKFWRRPILMRSLTPMTLTQVIIQNTIVSRIMYIPNLETNACSSYY